MPRSPDVMIGRGAFPRAGNISLAFTCMPCLMCGSASATDILIVGG